MSTDCVKNMVKSIIFVVLAVLGVAVLCVMFVPKTSDLAGGMTNPNARGFYGEPKNTIDLVVLGDSNAYCAYSPMVTWSKYGIPSYVAAEGNQTIVGAIDLLDEILTCQNPKMVVFDVNMLWSGNSDVQRLENCVTSMIQDSVPVIKYHNRWKTMSFEDSFKEKRYTFRSNTRGQRISRCVKPYVGENKMEKSDDNDSIPFITKYFFEKLLKKCEDRGIKVVLIETPTATSWTYARHVAMEEYAEKNDLEFIDFNTLTGKYAIDWNNDTKDGGMHMMCTVRRRLHHISESISRTSIHLTIKRIMRYTVTGTRPVRVTKSMSKGKRYILSLAIKTMKLKRTMRVCKTKCAYLRSSLRQGWYR